MVGSSIVSATQTTTETMKVVLCVACSYAQRMMVGAKYEYGFVILKFYDTPIHNYDS